MKMSNDFNPQAPRGARLLRIPGHYIPHISIHRPLAGPDGKARRLTVRFRNFNPQAPRGARQKLPSVRTSKGHFNPQAPRGARRRHEIQPCRHDSISIHRPLAGPDIRSKTGCRDVGHFNPQAPRGARRIWILSIS